METHIKAGPKNFKPFSVDMKMFLDESEKTPWTYTINTYNELRMLFYNANYDFEFKTKEDVVQELSVANERFNASYPKIEDEMELEK